MDGTYSVDDMAGEMPIGIQDFKEIRNDDSLYIDKSDMISQILSKKIKVYLYTRPRRFGKSLNLSMLDAFFNLKYPKDNKWFDGLKVSECEECQKHRNAYPVINFDFKVLGVDDLDTFYSDIEDEMCVLYSQYKYLLDSDSIGQEDKDFLNSVIHLKLGHIKLRKAITRLSQMLYKHHGKKVIILLDEYDNPINNSYGKPFQQDVVGFMRELLSSALKGNDSLHFGVVTGVMQIAKESIFSGLNNLWVNNIFSKEFDESFGFTDEEVKRICEDNGHPEKYREAKEWYDGYRFGNKDIYCPWSILQYVQSGFEPNTYWAGTSGNSILDNLLDRASQDILDELRSLAEETPIEYEVIPTITFQDIHTDVNNIYSMMVMTGYLTARVSDYGLSRLYIPNGEMRRVFGDLFLERVDARGPMHVRMLVDAFIAGDVDRIERCLYRLFASSAGNAMLNDEHSYQAFLTGMLMYIDGRYSVKADFEDGNGRYDIRLESRDGNGHNIVIEIKRIPTDSSDDAARSHAEKALCQIKDKDYTHGLKGRTLLYGIAFRNKKATVVSDVCTL